MRILFFSLSMLMCTVMYGCAAQPDEAIDVAARLSEESAPLTKSVTTLTPTRPHASLPSIREASAFNLLCTPKPKYSVPTVQCETPADPAFPNHITACFFPSWPCDYDKECAPGLLCDYDHPAGDRCGSCLAATCPVATKYPGNCAQWQCGPDLSPGIGGYPCVWSEECAYPTRCKPTSPVYTVPDGYCGVCGQ